MIKGEDMKTRGESWNQQVRSRGLGLGLDWLGTGTGEKVEMQPTDTVYSVNAR